MATLQMSHTASLIQIVHLNASVTSLNASKSATSALHREVVLRYSPVYYVVPLTKRRKNTTINNRTNTVAAAAATPRRHNRCRYTVRERNPFYHLYVRMTVREKMSVACTM
ncbi:hypothetical protein QTP88_022393 [Uroleucon formosanum]